jgi:AAA domain
MSHSNAYFEELETSSQFAATAYRWGKMWKRFSDDSDMDGAWVQVTRNTAGQSRYRSISLRQQRKLEHMRRHPHRYRSPHRFPRVDEVYLDIVRKLRATTDPQLQEQLAERLRNHINAGQQRPELQTWQTVPRFDPSAVTSTKWLIEHFIAEDNLQLIFSERGTFKTTLLMAAARAVAKGKPFLEMKTRRRRVLYLDYENPANIIKARNQDLHLRLTKNRNLIVWDRFGKQAPPLPGDARLEAIVANCVRETGHGPWIIFDSWSSLLQPGEGGENTGQIAPIYAHLRRLADAGATITVLDHSRKYETDVIYGGGDKEAKVDSIHHLQVCKNELEPNNAIVRVESWLKRYAPRGAGVFAFEVQSLEDDRGEWHITGLKRVADPVEEEKRKKFQLLGKLIQEHPEAGSEELAKIAANEGLGRDEAKKLLKGGIGKHWDLEKAAHGKHTFKLVAA